MVRAIENQTPDEMRVLIDGLRRKVESGLAVLLITAAEGKVQLVAGLSRDLIDRGLHAGNWLKQVAPIVGGGGGGRPDLAQAGGKTPEKIPDAPRASQDRRLPRCSSREPCRPVTSRPTDPLPHRAEVGISAPWRGV